MGKLDGKVALVTGSGRGIGAAYAKGLAAAGARVVVADVIDAEATVKIITQAGGTAIGRRMDVTDDAAIAAAVKAAVDGWGRLDILVNNAAMFTNITRAPFMELTNDEWDKLMQVNVRGIFQCAKGVVPQMRKQKYGKIINISSGSVFKGMPNMLHYVTSKGAVVAFTRALAREVGADNICVNTLAPGYTDSELIVEQQKREGTKQREMQAATRALKRPEMPEDLVGACVFLASPDSDFMTGQALVVDGGSAMH